MLMPDVLGLVHSKQAMDEDPFLRLQLLFLDG